MGKAHNHIRHNIFYPRVYIYLLWHCLGKDFSFSGHSEPNFWKISCDFGGFALSWKKSALCIKSKSMPVTGTVQREGTQVSQTSSRPTRQSTINTPSRLIFYPKPIPPPQVLPITRTVSVSYTSARIRTLVVVHSPCGLSMKYAYKIF